MRYKQQTSSLKFPTFDVNSVVLPTTGAQGFLPIHRGWTNDQILHKNLCLSSFPRKRLLFFVQGFVTESQKSPRSELAKHHFMRFFLRRSLPAELTIELRAVDNLLLLVVRSMLFWKRSPAYGLYRGTVATEFRKGSRPVTWWIWCHLHQTGITFSTSTLTLDACNVGRDFFKKTWAPNWKYSIY